MKLEVGKLYKTTEDLRFVVENYLDYMGTPNFPPRFNVQKGTILLCVENRQDLRTFCDEQETVFIYKNHKVVPENISIERNADYFFERML